MAEIFKLFLIFAKIGAITFGGGYAMLPFLQRELIEKRNWTSDEDLTDYFAIGQCTPGVIAVNTATFIGHKRAGVAGAISATLGVVFPSIVIISLFAAVIGLYADLPIVQSAFAGIRTCVCVLIFNAIIKLWKSAIINKLTIIIFILVFLLSFFTDISPIILVISSGALFIAVNYFGFGGKK